MQIFIQIYCGEKYTLKVDSSVTALDVKLKIQERVGVPPYKQRLIYNGYQFLEHEKLSDRNVQDGSLLDVIHG